MDLIVEKAVELGAAAIAPLLSERTVVKSDREAIGWERGSAARREMPAWQTSKR